MTRRLTRFSRQKKNLKDISRVLYPMYLQHDMNTIDSTKLIELAKADYKMLKEKGKEGEEVLHYNGFLDGFARGLHEGSTPWHRVSEELPKENKPVIIAFKFKGEWIYDKGYYADNELQADSLSVLDIVEYWMEIPEIKED